MRTDPWEYIKRSQTLGCGNWDWGHAIPKKGIHKMGFSLQCGRSYWGLLCPVPSLAWLAMYILYSYDSCWTSRPPTVLIWPPLHLHFNPPLRPHRTLYHQICFYSQLWRPMTFVFATCNPISLVMFSVLLIWPTANKILDEGVLVLRNFIFFFGDDGGRPEFEFQTYFFVFFVWVKKSTEAIGGGAQRPILRVHKPKKTCARSARKRSEAKTL